MGYSLTCCLTLVLLALYCLMSNIYGLESANLVLLYTPIGPRYVFFYKDKVYRLEPTSPTYCLTLEEPLVRAMFSPYYSSASLTALWEVHCLE